MADERSFSGESTPRIVQATPPEHAMEEGKKEGKAKKRSIFSFGKKKAETGSKAGPSPPISKEPSQVSSASQSTTTTRPGHDDHHQHAVAVPVPVAVPASPTRGLAGSPLVSSPATSQIFERDVQDSALVPRPTSSAIPNHIQTENYIPSVLDDASEAITNRRLDPDAVEIVTHTSHQPASVTVTGSGHSVVGTPHDQTSNEWARELASFADRIGVAADGASNYGSLDSSDVRRLSFISFADVVQHEHTSHHLAHVRSRDNLHIAGLTSLSATALNRSPSPIRSPVSSQGGAGTSPPTSNPGSIKGIDLSPPRKPLGSPTAAAQHLNLAPADVNIETMTQALRRTASTDMSRYRSTPQSPVDAPSQ